MGIQIKNIDIDHIARVVKKATCSDIKSICNDAYLRCLKNANTEDIERSYERIMNSDYDEKKML